MIALPEKPWEEGATFTNDETKVTYTFDGEKWLASGGEEADLSGFATKTFADEVDRTSQMRDEALDSKVDEESAKNTVVHLRLEDQILRCYAWSEGDNEKLERKLTAVDEDLQKQIDEIGGANPSDAPRSANFMAYFQLLNDPRLAEGCFNLLNASGQVVSKSKDARFLTFHIIEGWDDCEWMKFDLTGKGQIHITGGDGVIHLSKFVIGAEKRDGQTGGDVPANALWSFELEEYGYKDDWTFIGDCFLQFDSCLKEPS